MSERSEAPRSGGRAQSRGTAGGPERRVSRDADTGTGARAARRSEGADTRRSGIRSGNGRDTAAPVDGATALSIEVAGDTPPAPGSRPRLWVAPPLPIRAPRATFAAAVIAVVLVGVLGILLINTKTMEQSFRLDALRKEKAELNKQQQELQRQLVEASGPGNLTAAARRLGLIAADDPAVLRLPTGEFIGPLNPARGRTSPTLGEGLDKATGTGEGAEAEAGAAGTGTGTAGTGTGTAGTGTGTAGTGTGTAGTGTGTAGTGTTGTGSSAGGDAAKNGGDAAETDASTATTESGETTAKTGE